ncbi:MULTISPECIES: translation elongation factor Ts [unclassified Pyramidobacter]|uniref:translation elongation factor Ts n=1 Tax=unclassified Pyramidobacter TaxID=2632171 RepID=UPI0025E3E5F0|nr:MULTISPECIES: translation elongation factor Ts [unclassified Pyramidobacter]MCI7404710.1 translation elongation factor Ts [Pyramidobacter sp.]MDY3213570.1 translation elongation factor Ts [Pyramidobacter sp.]WOL39021.1 translation elongation factor Ts [Pyramidobacter sp. YE332]
MEITAAVVKELRDRTGCGMMDCKKALVECNGDAEKAIDFLREKGLAKAAKKADRNAKDGRVFSYIHNTGKIGVMVEIDCETDFVAKTDEFQQLGHDIAMQIAAANPAYVAPEDVPADVLEREKNIYREQLIAEGKPADRLDKIIEGKVRKYYEQSCLLEQAWIRDGDKKINDLVIALIAKMGENMKVRRFSRFSIGE